MTTQNGGLTHLTTQLALMQNQLIELQRTISLIVGSVAVQDGLAPEPKPAIDKLTETESQVFKLVGIGKKSAEIALILKIKKRTVEAHRYNIQRKLGINALGLKALAKQSLEKA